MLLITDPECDITDKQFNLGSKFNRCIPLYDPKKEDKTPYSKPGWEPVTNISVFASVFELNNMCPIPWRYQSSRTLQTLSYQGAFIRYDGGGYVADLGYNEETAFDVVDKLTTNNWIDESTVVVFVEFTIFEPSSLLFSAVKFVYEKLPTGGSYTGSRVNTLTVYSATNAQFEAFYQVCRLLLMIVILFFFFVEIGKIYRQGCKKYCKGFWNWMEFIQITTAVASVVMFFLKEKYASWFVKRVRSNPFETSSTDYLVFWSETEIYLLSVVIFVVTIKFLRLIRFNHHVSEITSTIRDSAKNLLSFFVVFFCLLMAFTQLGYLIFGSMLPPYSSFFHTLRAILQMLLGGNMYFFELQSIDPIIGPIFVFVYMLSMMMVLLNMFLAIINEAYMDVKYEDEDDEDEEEKKEKEEEITDAELGSFTKQYFATHIGYLRDEFTSFLKRLACKSHRKAYINKTTVDYVAIPDEEPPAYNDIKDNEREEEDTMIPLATLEDLEDLKLSLSDIGAELRQSILSLSPHTDDDQQDFASYRSQQEKEPLITKPVSIFDRQPTIVNDYEPYEPYIPSYQYQPICRTSQSFDRNKEPPQNPGNKFENYLSDEDSCVERLSCSCEERTSSQGHKISGNGQIPSGHVAKHLKREHETSV